MSETTQVSASVILDSVSPFGSRLTTLEVTFHRFVLAEFNTHRVFSRNSASSRAIPVQKQLDRIKEHPAVPVEFGTNQPGMQAGPPLEGEELVEATLVWLAARNDAVRHAEALMELGVHKQVANRLLEPFMWHTVIVTATEWEGFWHQRISELAQPEIHVAADAMKRAYDASSPREVAMGEWHAPYVSAEDDDAIAAWSVTLQVPRIEVVRRISAARCARVSYLTHDGVRSVEKDLELYDRLVSADPKHASPLEHVATPAYPSDEAAGDVPGNFDGWYQLRHKVAGF